MVEASLKPAFIKLDTHLLPHKVPHTVQKVALVAYIATN